MDLQAIKDRVRIEDLIGETLTIQGRGKMLTTAEHDSLKIRTDWQRWFWYSKDAQGDIFDWVMMQERCDFRGALEWLAAKAGIELTPLTPAQQQAQSASRQREQVLQIAADYYHRMLVEHPGAEAGRSYCYETRHWERETVVREQIGYVLPSDKALLSPEESAGMRQLHQLLRDAGLMDHPAARAVLSIPAGMIVYVHRERGKVVYLSGRSIEGKRHYNLPEDAVGAKRPYVNDPEHVVNGAHLLVEGQADAISLAQLGIQATAICGLTTESVRCSHVAFDNDKAGQAKALETALHIDPLCRVVTWPESLRHREDGHNHVTVKDAADLLQADPDAVDVDRLLDESPQALQILAGLAGKAKDEERKELLDRFFRLYCGLDEMVATDLKPDLATRLCGKLDQFNRLLKAHEKMSKDGENDSPEKYEYSAGGAKGGIVWEQVYTYDNTGVGKSLYAVRTVEGKIELKTSIDIGNTTFHPYPGDMGLIQKKVILFPEKPEPYQSVKILLNRVQSFIHTYLDIDATYERIASYYVLMSWLYDLFPTLPYLRALGDYGTGKTRFIQTIGAVCYRPMFTSGASTTSPIFRIIDMFKGTLIMDEADLSDSSEQSEVIKIFNVGYYDGGVVLRSEKDPASKYDDYWPSAKDVYGPKILATRRKFEDRATESRCLTKRMTTARPDPRIPHTIGIEFWAEAVALRNQLLMYRLENHRPIELPASLADESVEPRLNQITMALKAIARGEPEMLNEITMFMRHSNEQMIQDRNMTVEAIVLQAMVNMFYDRSGLFSIRDFSINAITEKAKEIALEFDPDIKITNKIAGEIIRNEFGLTTERVTSKVGQKIKGRYEPQLNEEQLANLMARYGIIEPY